MKLCDRHYSVILTHDKDADLVKVFSDFINKYIGLEHQDSVEYRKNNCPICYLGRPGSKYLKQIVDKNRKIIVTS